MTGNSATMMNDRQTGLALYVHWPFCISKCPYCDFNSHVRADIDDQAWAKALLADMAYEAGLTPDGLVHSIFFGGGTPSLMPPALVARLIDAAGQHWGFTDDVEITLEANPSSVEAARFGDLAAAGVNRVSLGLQSFDDAALRFLGRAHGAEEGLAALGVAQQNFERVSFDLIYALPDQTLDQWRAMLQRALDQDTGHLSLYQLTIEPNTRFASDVRRGLFDPMDGDRAADFYALTEEMTHAAGLPAYEISNHARPGEESRHNLTYWRYGDYIGIGPGAHGRRLQEATERHKKPENYLSAVARNGRGIKTSRHLAPREAASEALMMGLRLTEGVDLAMLAARFGLSKSDIIDRQKLAMLNDMGLCEAKNDHIRVVRKAHILLDTIIAELAVFEEVEVAS
ncbi:MAG: radical SAM family heme chaperone HemW [Pseudomonadota bacterium]